MNAPKGFRTPTALLLELFLLAACRLLVAPQFLLVRSQRFACISRGISRGLHPSQSLVSSKGLGNLQLNWRRCKYRRRNLGGWGTLAPIQRILRRTTTWRTGPTHCFSVCCGFLANLERRSAAPDGASLDQYGGRDKEPPMQKVKFSPDDYKNTKLV